MKHNLIISVFAAALLGSGVANAAETLYASQYTSGELFLDSKDDFDKLVMNQPLTITPSLHLYDGATIEFQKKQAAEAICSISTQAYPEAPNVYFNNVSAVYNITFNDDAQAIVAASAGTPITLIQDLNMESTGFSFYGGISPSDTILQLNGKGYNETVELDGVQFTYVGPKADDYTFQTGEIGFTGYEDGSHALNLVVGGGSVPEPTTGSLSLLALAGLCIRRRR